MSSLQRSRTWQCDCYTANVQGCKPSMHFVPHAEVSGPQHAWQFHGSLYPYRSRRREISPLTAIFRASPALLLRHYAPCRSQCDSAENRHRYNQRDPEQRRMFFCEGTLVRARCKLRIFLLRTQRCFRSIFVRLEERRIVILRSLEHCISVVERVTGSG